MEKEKLASTVEGNGRKGLSLVGLIAIVLSAMVGGGIFNIAENMASSAGVGAVAIAWAITGVGMVFLVLTFRDLSRYFPTMNEGIYQYAREGFGRYAGFNIAWGYWLCVALGNVAFAVMLNDAFGAFFPVFLNHGWPTVVFSICLIWIMFGIVVNGVMNASFINTVMTVLKFSAVIIIIAILVIYLRIETLTSDIWGEALAPGQKPLGGLWSQVMSTMLVTMFCFVGVEGAMMLSSYAKNHSDVGKASVIGFYLALLIYALISILCYGVRTRMELAQMPDPSVAYVMKEICGAWAYYFVVITVLVSLLSGFIAWTLLCAQTPYGAAREGIFPPLFLKKNHKDVPVNGLMISSVFMSGFIFLVCSAPNVYMAALNLTTIMVLPVYGICGAFLFKESLKGGMLKGSVSQKELVRNRVIGAFCFLYCCWCIVSGGILLFLASSILYLIGFYFYYLTYRYEKAKGLVTGQMLTRGEKLLLCVIIMASVAAIVLIILGKISLS